MSAKNPSRQLYDSGLITHAQSSVMTTRKNKSDKYSRIWGPTFPNSVMIPMEQRSLSSNRRLGEPTLKYRKIWLKRSLVLWGTLTFQRRFPWLRQDEATR